MTDQDRARFDALNKENLEFLMDRYNRVNRWVIADMVRRTAYHYPHKTAVVFGDRTLSYEQLETAFQS
jgi:fatty-acyl-CoA synthase